MSSVYGKNIKVSIFGQSHSAGIGVVIDGIPAGEKFDEEKIRKFCARRAPGSNSLGTPRKEADEFEVLSGVTNSKFCGAPFAAVIKNTNVKPGDYSEFSDKPRPGHADYTANIKYNGASDFSGGGHFSGRLTAPLCIAGSVFAGLLEEKGIYIGSHHEKIGGVSDKRFDPAKVTKADFDSLYRGELTVIDKAQHDKMADVIKACAADGDSVGGVIECAVTGLPAGIGEPMFDGLENRIAQAVFAVPGVKGIEFGAGFAAAEMRGSENNDPFIIEDSKIKTQTNNHGGILGGISSGMPLIFRAAMKPTPSIFKEQKTVSISKNEQCTLSIKGRHDPCIAVRALACIESAAAIAVYDALLDYYKTNR
ncbi:MAG: chorismate synthase [Ruminococcaceae bacterium]|nr:chorismate synthase [Oscillospiraceae bacterium]